MERWCHHSLVNSFSLEANAKKMRQKLEHTFRSRDVWPKDMNLQIRTNQVHKFLQAYIIFQLYAIKSRFVRRYAPPSRTRRELGENQGCYRTQQPIL